MHAVFSAAAARTRRCSKSKSPERRSDAEGGMGTTEKRSGLHIFHRRLRSLRLSASAVKSTLSMKLSTLTATLAQLGMQPSKSLGQNFLHDQNLASWIVAQLDLRPGEPWVEL